MPTQTYLRRLADWLELAVRVHGACLPCLVLSPCARDRIPSLQDASTCRPYLIHGIVECVRAAQAGGAGLVVYSRQEGNALGEVSKFLVHNARKKLGDSVDNFFEQQRRYATQGREPWPS